MISNIFDFEKSKLSFINAFRVLKLNKLLNQSNITKAKGHRAIDIFLFIFSLAFTNKSLYRHLQSNKSIDDNTFYRFLNNSSFNWRKFIHCLCFKIISEFKNLTSEKRVKVLILDMLSLDMHVIAMVKQLKQVYLYKGCYHTLNSLFKLTKNSYHNSSDIISSVIVKTKGGIDVKLVFVKNKNKKNQYLTLLCTDITVEEDEILRIYGNRWSIEVMFKVSKDLLKLNKEFKTVSFDIMISHISIVFTRYMILEYLKLVNYYLHFLMK